MKKYTLSLRVWHPRLSVDDIASRVGMSAAYAQNLGSVRQTPKGTILGGVYQQSYCSFELIKKTEGDFPDGIRGASNFLRSIASSIDFITESGGRAEIYIWIHPEKECNLGFELGSDISKLLSELNLNLSVEIFT